MLKRTVSFQFLLILGVLTFVSRPTQGSEFVIMNKVISWDINASDAFWQFKLDATMPSNWASPNDYYNGMIYTRYEVLSVATSEPFGMQFDIFQWKDQAHTLEGELCENVSWLNNGVGSVVEKGSSPSGWWKKNGGADFSKMNDLQSLSVTIWCNDPMAPISKAGAGGDDAGLAWGKRFNWFPATIRVTIVAVSSGSTFSGWDHYIINPALQKPVPTYGVDFLNETTNKVFPATDEYSMFPGMAYAFSGNGQKLTLTPGRRYYFRTKAGDGLLASPVQLLEVPERPATPTFALDVVNHRTTVSVDNTFEYSDSYDMSGAVTGSDTQVSIPAGTTKYFRKKATAGSFSSNVQSLNESSHLPIAHELLILNEVIDYPNVTDTNGFYYFWHNGDMPVNWKSPDNYYDGEIYVRYEILSQHTSTAIGLQFGIWQKLPPETGELHETMSGISVLNGPGSVVTTHSSPSTWWKLDQGFDFTRMNLVWHFGINPWKVSTNEQIRQENPDVWNERFTYWFPMKVYVTVVAVASGQTFSGWNNYLGIKSATPAYTVNYNALETGQAIPTTDEYSYSATMTPAYSGTGNKLALVPGQDVYFRTKAQGSYTISEVQHLVVPERSAAPAFAIDFSQENTSLPVTAEYEYSYQADMSNSATGNGSKLNIAPGSTVYFRKLATANSFASLTQALTAPVRPAAPEFTIDYAASATTEPVSNTTKVSEHPDFSGPSFGNGEKWNIEPGKDLYFQLSETSSSFCSDIFHLAVPGRNTLQYFGNDTITQSKFVLVANILDGFSSFSLDNLVIVNGTATNLRGANLFDVYADSKGFVSVLIPANALSPNSFASNEVKVYCNITVTDTPELNGGDFTVYPNPSKEGIIYIRNSSNVSYTVEIVSTEGKIVRSLPETNVPDQPLNISDLHKGLYFVKITAENEVSMQKIVLE